MSLPDAEATENGAEDFVGGNLSCDGAKVIEGFAEVDDDKVGGNALRHTFSHLPTGGKDLFQRLVVAYIGDYLCIDILRIALDQSDQLVFQLQKSLARFGANLNGLRTFESRVEN